MNRTILASVLLLAGAELRARDTELAKKLAGVKFEKYSDAPGYSEGPTWRDVSPTRKRGTYSSLARRANEPKMPHQGVAIRVLLS
jgi:hypothetical protein